MRAIGRHECQSWILPLPLASMSGERGRNRTFNLLIKSQLLCQLSYAPTRGGRFGQILGYHRPTSIREASGRNLRNVQQLRRFF